MRYNENKAKQKKTKSVLHAGKHRMCTQKIRKSKYTQKIKQLQNTRIQMHRMAAGTLHFLVIWLWCIDSGGIPPITIFEISD